MIAAERVWCVVLHGGETRRGAQGGADVGTLVERAAMIGARQRTWVATTRGTARDERWPGDVSVCSDVRRWATGPLVLHAAMRIAVDCPDAIVATLGEEPAVADAIRFAAAVRQGARWVAAHPSHVVALAEPNERWRAWGADPTARVRPPRHEDVPAGAWRPLSLVFRVDTVLRLMEVFQPSWWAVARSRVTGDGGATPEWPCRLGSFDVVDDVLVRSIGQLRVQPVLPSMLLRGPDDAAAPSARREACGA